MKMKTTRHDIDSVAMKRRGARAVHERLQGTSREERLAFWAERTQQLRERQAARSSRDAPSTSA